MKKDPLPLILDRFSYRELLDLIQIQGVNLANNSLGFISPSTLITESRSLKISIPG